MMSLLIGQITYNLLPVMSGGRLRTEKMVNFYSEKDMSEIARPRKRDREKGNLERRVAFRERNEREREGELREDTSI